MEFDTPLQTSHLGFGMHRLCYRFSDAAGVFSPVQSSIFWKTGQKLVAYEYWFDDHYPNKIAGQMACGKEESWIIITEIPATQSEKIFVRFKDSGGLWSSVVSLDIPDPVYVQTTEWHQNITLFPNPADEKLNISYQTEPGVTVNFTVYDPEGKKVLIRDFGYSTGLQQTQMVDVSRLGNGVYLCVLETTNGRSVFKAIINR